MKINKIINNYLEENLKDLFIKNKHCCGKFNFTVTCCNGKEKWHFFNGVVNLTRQLKTKHIVALEYFKKHNKHCCLDTKKLVLNCCNNKEFFSLEDIIIILPTQTLLITVPTNCNLVGLSAHVTMTHVLSNTVYNFTVTRPMVFINFTPILQTILKGNYTFHFSN